MAGICWVKVGLAAGLALGVAWSSGAIARQVIRAEPLTVSAYKIEVAAPSVASSAPVEASAGVPETAASAPASAPALPPVAPLLAAADPVKGQQIAKVCAACHTFDKGGPNRVGPNLWGIVNANRAHLGDGFAYSAAMKSVGGVWGYEELNAYLAKPRQVVPGNKMAFAGLNKPEDRANVIAYLRTLADSPAPLP